MSWISAFSAWQWGLMALVPPAVLMLYFLKLRRSRMEVPSTYLWRRTIEDLHVNSIWQRLRQSLLLYLQLAFLLILILACLRPGFSNSQSSGKRMIFLIDNSASMQATDVKPTRLDAAKEMVRERLQSMNSNDVAMLLAFSDRADVRQGFTSNKQQLLSALQSIAPTNRTTDLTEALRAASGLANPGRASFEGVNDFQVGKAIPATLSIFTDGGFSEIGEFDVGNLSAEYVPIGESAADNVGILAFSVQRNEERPEQIEAFGRLMNCGPEAIETMVSLYMGDTLLDAARTKVEAGKEAAVSFSLRNLNAGQMRLEVDRPDSMMVDNQAFAALRPPRQLNILLVTPGNNGLSTALATEAIKRLATVTTEGPPYLQSPDYVSKAGGDFFDLVIYDQCAPEKMPNANTFFIGAKPPGEEWQLGEMQSPLIIVDIDRSHPMMEYLEMGAIKVYEGRPVTAPDGGSNLMTADLAGNASVLGIAPRGAYQDAVLGFTIVNSLDQKTEVNTNWAIYRSFPVFIYAAVEYLGGGATVAAAPTVQPGQSIGLKLSNRFDSFTIKDPTGAGTSVDRGDQSQIVFTKTETPGIYSVFGKDREQPLEVFTVNLFSGRESDINAASDLMLGATKVDAVEGKFVGRKEFWRWLLACALLLLVLEWVVYNRRVFV